MSILQPAVISSTVSHWQSNDPKKAMIPRPVWMNPPTQPMGVRKPGSWLFLWAVAVRILTIFWSEPIFRGQLAWDTRTVYRGQSDSPELNQVFVGASASKCISIFSWFVRTRYVMAGFDSQTKNQKIMFCNASIPGRFETCKHIHTHSKATFWNLVSYLLHRENWNGKQSTWGSLGLRVYQQVVMHHQSWPICVGGIPWIWNHAKTRFDPQLSSFVG